MSSWLRFLYSQFFVTPPVPTKSFAEKTVIITGSNVGLGLEAARHIVRLKASKVILAVRNLEKGQAAKASIEESEKCGGKVIEVWQLDLSSYESVKAFARKVETLPRVDSIVENAGMSTQRFQLAEGHESTITVNVISTFLLALLVLPKLKETASKFNTRPHLSIVSSEVHFWTDFTERKNPEIFAALDDKAASDMSGRYFLSKLLEVFVVREIFDSLIKDKDSYPVIINYLNPGLCHSELMRDLDGIAVRLFNNLLARSTEVGSRTLVNAALEIGDQSQGQYLSDCNSTPPAPFVTSKEGQETQKRIWQELSKILEDIQPGVIKNI